MISSDDTPGTPEAGTPPPQPKNSHDISEKTSTSPINNTNMAATLASIPVDSEQDAKVAPPRDERHQKQLSALTGLSRIDSNAGGQRGSGGNAAGQPPRQPQQQRQPQQRGQRRERREPTEEEKAAQKKKEIKYGADAVVSLILPISICMAVVVALIKSVSYYSEDPEQGFVGAEYEKSEQQDNAQQFTGAVINTLIIVAVIIVLTTILFILFYFKCYKFLGAYLGLAMMALLGYFSYEVLIQILVSYNAVLSKPTVAFMIWNYGMVGIIHLLGWGPLLVQQFYHITVCAIMALMLGRLLPEWTTWVLLFAVSIWDLVAVLCPFGPLRLLVETAQDREVNMPNALIYSTMVWITMAEPGRMDPTPLLNSPSTANEPKREKPAAHQEQQEEKGGPKLGLGDFIFYSLLVGAAATNSDWGTVFACYVAIVVGLTLTLFILILKGQALPALPFSIMLALMFYFSTDNVLSPMIEKLSFDIVYI
eukprot:m.337246 g.337246  ORF g.337246 m.337246 type:complete len:480 (-) comp18084_c0_seq1:64-1503(-)